METKFFTFDQNNSGGSFDHEPNNGIGYCVCVEAIDYVHANARAEQIGVYFDGCDSGRDCDCCGNRWSRAYEYDNGDSEPTLYDKPLKGGWGIPSYVHYLDGRIEVRPVAEFD